MARLRHGWLAVTTLPALLFNHNLRLLLAEMRTFCRNLPSALKGSLPEALQQLTPAADNVLTDVGADYTRNMADLAALLDRRSPLGLCLRRSLTRYHFLRRIGVPVVLQFGAKFVAGKPDREVGGHAWLTLNGRPYYEADENRRGFTVMFSFPDSNPDSNS
ncbi:MAG: lasso peptide biosynthesis B2 protein [Chloroflexota bacterium]